MYIMIVLYLLSRADFIRCLYIYTEIIDESIWHITEGLMQGDVVLITHWTCDFALYQVLKSEFLAPNPRKCDGWYITKDNCC